MQKTAFFLLLLTAITLGNAVSAFPAEELFDTKAAAKHTEKGIDHLRIRNYDAAIKEFEEAVAINPDAEAHYFLGYAYYMKGKTGDAESRKKAKENFDKAYELNPNFTPQKIGEPPATAPQPAAPARSAPEPTTGDEGPGSGVFRGSAQPEQPAPPGQPAATEPLKEQQPAEPPKEEQPPQQPEPKPY